MKRLIIGIGGRKQSGKDTVGSMLVQSYGFTRVGFGDRIKQITHAIFDYPEERLFGSDAEKNRADERGNSESFWQSVHAKVDSAEVRTLILETCSTKGAPSFEISPVDAMHEIIDKYMRPMGGTLTSRKVMQYIGTEWRDRFGYQRVWTDFLFWSMDVLMKGQHDYDLMQGLVARDQPLMAPRQRFTVTDMRFLHELDALSAERAHTWFMDAEKRLGPLDPNEHPSEPRIEAFRDRVERVIDNNGTLEALRAQVSGLTVAALLAA